MYEELKEWKALLDDGVITQEEYDAKKKQILGLGESAQEGVEATGEPPSKEKQAIESGDSPIKPGEGNLEELTSDEEDPRVIKPAISSSGNSETGKSCLSAGDSPADEPDALKRQAENKTGKEKKKRYAIIAIAAAILIALFGLATCMFADNIDDDLTTIKRIFRAYTGEALLSNFSDIEEQDDGDLRADSVFSEIEGYYDIVINEDTDRVEWLIFRWDDGQDFDVTKVVSDINNSLGKYKEYNEEFDSYTWENDWLSIEFYPEEGIWIELRVNDVPKDSPCNNHDWREALCEQPETCLDCGATEGEALGHDDSGKMTLDYIDVEEGKAYYSTKCTRCGDKLERETRDIDSLASDGKLMLSISDFTERLDYVLEENDSWLEINSDAVLGTVSEYPACAVVTKGANRQIAGIVYYDGKAIQTDKDSTNNTAMMITKVSTASSEEFAAATSAVIMAMNPDLNANECLDIAKKTAKRALNGDIYSYHGIKYGLESDGATFYVAAS